jgi:hypothetical protein
VRAQRRLWRLLASKTEVMPQKEAVPEKESPETPPDSPLLDLSDASRSSSAPPRTTSPLRSQCTAKFLYGRLVPASPAVPAATEKNQHNDEDYKKCRRVHADLLCEAV